MEFGGRDAPGVHRVAVEGAPLVVPCGEDLVADHDVGVQVRVAGTGVPVVVRRGDEPSRLDLRDGTIRGAGTHPRGGELALHEVDDVAYGRVVGVGDDRLRAGIGHRPQHAGGLGHREGVVEAGDGRPWLLRRVVRVLLVDRVGAAELVAGDRVPPVADQQRQLGLGDFGADLQAEVLDAGAHPSAWWCPGLGVVAGQRCRQGSVAIAGHHGLEQVLVAGTRRHLAHRHHHRAHLR